VLIGLVSKQVEGENLWRKLRTSVEQENAKKTCAVVSHSADKAQKLIPGREGPILGESKEGGRTLREKE